MGQSFCYNKRKIRKNDRIFLLKGYVALILSASKKQFFGIPNGRRQLTDKRLYKMVARILQENVLVSTASYGIGVQKVSFMISNVMHFSYNKDEKGIVTARDFINGLIKHEFRLGTSTAVRSFPVTVVIQKCQTVQKYLDYKKV
nr:unnamed protein product [Callosobruchus analis]